MRRREVNPKVAWGGLLFGVLYGLLCTVLILTGVLSGTLWFTVVAMVLLAISFGIQLVGHHRNRDRG